MSGKTLAVWSGLAGGAYTSSRSAHIHGFITSNVVNNMYSRWRVFSRVLDMCTMEDTTDCKETRYYLCTKA